MDTTTPGTAMVTWSAIECIDQNGIITGYAVQFQEQDGRASVAGGVVNVNNRTYTVSGLSPATRYTFRVAGITSGGQGPLSPARVVTTMDGRKFTITRIISLTKYCVELLQLLVLYLTLRFGPNSLQCRSAGVPLKCPMELSPNMRSPIESMMAVLQQTPLIQPLPFSLSPLSFLAQ